MSGSTVTMRLTTMQSPDVVKHWTLREFYWAMENGEAELTEFLVCDAATDVERRIEGQGPDGA